MNIEIISGLIYNATLLLTISIVYNSLFLGLEDYNIRKRIVAGVIIGFVGILLMLTPVEIAPGIIFDTRSILVSVTAMFFGFIPSFVAAVIIIIFRIIIGGNGVLMGVLVTILTASIGLIWNKKRLKQMLSKTNNKFIEFYIVGLITHIVMVMCVLALPQDTIIEVFKQIVFPVILIYPIASLLFSIVLYYGFKNTQTRMELKKSEAKYKELYYEHQNKETLLKVLIDSVPDLIFYKDINSIYVGCNAAFEKFAGREEKDLIGFSDLDIFDKEMATMFRKMDKDMLIQGKPRRNDEVVTYPDGSKVFLETLKTPYSNSDGTVLGLIGISRDITERKKREQEILYLTYHDVLTGLYNRTFFEKEIRRLDTEQQLPLSVIVGDINGLKLINDALGHKEGDKLLVEVAKILRFCCRSQDIISRIGGDEFCILLPKTDMQDAQLVLDRIKKKCLECSNKAHKEVYYASISLGHATKLKIKESIEKTLNIAEDRMYKLKLLEYKSIHNSIISSIKKTMFEKSNETEEHSERLAELSKKLGKALGLNDEELTELELLSTLHDIGKISIDGCILKKTGKLTENDWSEIRKHPEIGYRITHASLELRHISEYILSHHERWDGKGYPQGLSGTNIPLLSRIIAIVDSFDAMTHDRTYRKAMTKESAIQEIIKNAGTQFDPEISQVFINNVLE
ncbi:MAG: HD domain-containing phosphohydrolase [Eubacteriaceae bacterium]